MSEAPPLGYLDFSPIAAVAGLVFVATVAASFLLGADPWVRRAVSLLVVGVPATATLVWACRYR